MADIYVNIATLEQCCDNNEKYTKHLEDQKVFLDQVEKDLLSHWEGVASQNYKIQFDSKQQTLEQIILGMQRVNYFDRTSVTIYREANKAVTTMINGMF